MNDDLGHNIAAAAEELDVVLELALDETARQGQLPRAHNEGLQKMAETLWVSTHWDIAWPTWPRGVRAKIGALGQKVIRAVIAWYVDRIMRDQNQYNLAIYQLVQMLSEEVRELREGRARDRARMDALAADVAQLRQRLAETEDER